MYKIYWQCTATNSSNLHSIYRKFPKYSDPPKNCCTHSKIWTMWLYRRVMSPNNADGMANSVDPDQTGGVWSGSALFAQAYLSKNLGSLRYQWFISTKPKPRNWVVLFWEILSVVENILIRSLWIWADGWQKGPYDKIRKFENDAYFKNSIHVQPFLKISMIYYKR